ncbi:MAG: VOC family protein [Hyphomicrobiales bacterium]
MDSPIVHFQVASSNPEKMAEWLREVFEWEVGDGAQPGAVMNIATGWSDDIQVSGTLLPLHEGAPGYVAVYVRVRDLWATVQRAAERGAEVRVPRMSIPNGPDIAVIAHPEGQVFGIVQL